ncbi:MAG: hypothetical protein JWO08_6, partial [Verrucomicrobiaceae bacterium]|nr:hypothetical protein [Verrucomicrobiaceae bacterium]
EVGHDESNEVALVVLFKPSITTPPGPALKTIPAGTEVSYTVTASGSAPLSYQWKKDNVKITGATDATLDLGAADWFDQGNYTVVVTNTLGTVTATAAKLVVQSPPIIKTQPPAFKALLPGGAGTVAAVAVGPPTLRYQWFKGADPILGATKTSYAWAGAKVDVEGVYTLKVTNDFGNTVSDTVTVDVIDGPKITTQPQAAQTLATNDLLSLSVSATGDAHVPLSYQWQLNGVNIPGATDSLYQVAAVNWFNQGTYRVIVSNLGASVTSKNAVVTLHSPPVIITPLPATRKVARNGTGVLKVVAGGSPALTYQWSKGGVDILGAKAASYTLTRASDATVADYSVKVTNTYGNISGGIVHVIVEDAPLITKAPQAQVKPLAGVATFEVIASGSPDLRYQWQRNNINIPGATASTFSMGPLAMKDAASYRVLVTNDVGTATSVAAKLTVLIPPAISKHPLSQIVFQYDDVMFSGAATGSPTITYQWQKDGVNIIGAKAATLSLKSVPLAVAGTAESHDYTLVATNSVGTATSNSAHLTINPIPAPEINMMSPYRGKVGFQVLIRGANLRWTTKVTFNGKTAAFIKVNATELIATVPVGATTGPLVITTLGGGTISSQAAPALHHPTFTVTTKTENDNFENARFLTAGFYFLIGDSVVDATTEPNEPYFTRDSNGYRFYPTYSTIWYRWRPPVTGFYVIDTGGSPFNTILAVFRGEQMDKLSVVGYNNNIRYGDEHSSVSFVASKSEDYYIMVDGEYATASEFDPLPPQGELALNIYKSLPTNSPKAGAIRTTAGLTTMADPYFSENKTAQPEPSAPPAAVPVQVADTFIGGSAASKQGFITADSETDLSTATAAHAALDFTIEAGAAATAESFTWQVQDAAGKSLGGLVFDAATKTVLMQSADGSSVATGQMFVAGAEYHLDIHTNRTAGTWGARLNGVWIMEDAPLPAGTSFDRLAALWAPAEGESTGSRMKYSHASVKAE